jgi:hypothetical protein
MLVIPALPKHRSGRPKNLIDSARRNRFECADNLREASRSIVLRGMVRAGVNAGRGKPRPYKRHQPMHMIWHQEESIQNDPREPPSQPEPAFANDEPHR